MKQRRPALEMYSSPERSSTTAPPSAAAVSTDFMRSVVNATQVSWSSRPSTRRTTALANLREETFIRGVVGGRKGAPIVSQPLVAEETELLLGRAVGKGENHPVLARLQGVGHPSGNDGHVVGRKVEFRPPHLERAAPFHRGEDHAVARAIGTRRESLRQDPDHARDGRHRPAAALGVLVSEDVPEVRIRRAAPRKGEERFAGALV